MAFRFTGLTSGTCHGSQGVNEGHRNTLYIGSRRALAVTNHRTPPVCRKVARLRNATITVSRLGEEPVGDEAVAAMTG